MHAQRVLEASRYWAGILHWPKGILFGFQTVASSVVRTVNNCDRADYRLRIVVDFNSIMVRVDREPDTITSAIPRMRIAIFRFPELLTPPVEDLYLHVGI